MDKFYCDLEGNLFWTFQGVASTLTRVIVQELVLIVAPDEIYNSAVSVTEFKQQFEGNPVQVITSIKEICPWSMDNLENNLYPEDREVVEEFKKKYA